MNKNTIIGSVLIGAIMIWWFFMNSANNEAAEKAKLAQKAAAKEAAVQVADSAEAPSANGLVLPGSTAEVKAAPVLGAPATDKVTEPAEVTSSSSEASDAIRGTGFAPQFTVSTAGRVLQVQNAAGNTMAIFDMQGRLLLTKRIATSVESALLPHTGTFILKIGPRTMRVNAR
jgi:hypothetical protein